MPRARDELKHREDKDKDEDEDEDVDGDNKDCTYQAIFLVAIHC